MSALLFGSISTLADTSELQRNAFNQAFADQGLSWNWDQEEYRSLLGGNGGADRIAAYAASRGETVDADAVHAAKSKIFQDNLAAAPLEPRPGVLDTIRDAREAGVKLGFVTTTSAENVSALFAALAPQVKASDFDVVLDASDVESSKPDPAAYLKAVQDLGESAGSVVAVEDNPGGVQAAAAAGIAVLAFPNENTAALDFGSATATVAQLGFDDVKEQLG